MHYLCTYRETPPTVTGIPPFTLLYGHNNVKGPLDALRSSRLTGEVDEDNYLFLVAEMKAKMLSIAMLITGRETMAK